MTPKEKAQELVKNFSIDNANVGWFNKGRVYTACGELSRYQVKKQTLICVDEMIKLTDGYANDNWQLKRYWQEVKQEIEKLLK
tara:strand:- start:7476 stop:7724 length:249 start_codon:yes stop_codon:yes gene_type:complete